MNIIFPRRNPEATSCAEHAVSVGSHRTRRETPEAMSLGLEALNSALSCAEATRDEKSIDFISFHFIKRKNQKGLGFLLGFFLERFDFYLKTLLEWND